MTGRLLHFQFLCHTVDRKHLTHFQSKTSLFKFLWHSVDEALICVDLHLVPAKKPFFFIRQIVLLSIPFMYIEVLKLWGIIFIARVSQYTVLYLQDNNLVVPTCTNPKQVLTCHHVNKNNSSVLACIATLLQSDLFAPDNFMPIMHASLNDN